jgi:hypothetical protein
MEDEKLFSENMAGLGEIFDKKISPALMEIYWQALAPYSDEQCRVAFNRAAKECRFFPKPVELIEFIEGSKKDLGFEVRAQIESWLYSNGPYPHDPIAQQVIRSYGGPQRLGYTDFRDLKFMLKDIEERVENYRAHEMREQAKNVVSLENRRRKQLKEGKTDGYTSFLERHGEDPGALRAG